MTNSELALVADLGAMNHDPAAQEKTFKAMDANKDGVLTLEEMHSFMHGTRRSVPQQWGLNMI